MRIIDINTAIGAPTKSFRFQDAEGLIEWLDEYRIEQALAWHSECQRAPWKGNDEMIRLAACSGGRVKACVGLNPSVLDHNLSGEGSIADKLREAKPSAVRVFPTRQDYPFDAFYARDLLAPVNELRMPVLIDAAYDNAFFSNLPGVAEAFPDARFVLLRWGLNHARTIFPLLKYTRNVYFDMSVMLDVYQIEEIVRDYGSERLLFGSGMPLFEPSGALGLLYYARISEADRENIAHRNFERLEAEIRYGV